MKKVKGQQDPRPNEPRTSEQSGKSNQTRVPREEANPLVTKHLFGKNQYPLDIALPINGVYYRPGDPREQTWNTDPAHNAKSGRKSRK
jgi:hypothetical protein